MNVTAIICLILATLLSAAAAYTTADADTAEKIKLYHSERSEQADAALSKRRVCLLSVSCTILGALSAGRILLFSTDIFQKLRLLCALVALTGAACNDFREKRIPNIFPLLCALLALGTHTAAFFCGADGETAEFFGSLAASLCAGLCFLLTSFLTKQGIGMGDVKLICSLALACGVFMFCRTLFFGMVLVAVTAAVLLLLRKKTLSDNLPFAPFLYLGFIAAVLTGFAK